MEIKTNIWKRWLSFALILALLLSDLPLNIFAAETDPLLSDFAYTVNEDTQTVTLTKYTGTDSEPEVYNSYVIDGVQYKTVIASETIFRGNTVITGVKLHDGVSFENNSMRYLFAECTKLTTVNLSGVDTAGVTDMSYLFAGTAKAPSALTSVDVTGLDTASVTTMRGMFSYCTKLTTITGYEDWDTGKLESMYQMFNRTSALSKVDLSRWDLDQIKNTGWCFQLCGAQEILLPDNLAVMSAGFLNHATKFAGSVFTIPVGVKKIGYAHTIYDFATNDFTEFQVAQGNEYYETVDGILYSADGTEMLAVPRNKAFENGIYEIPEGVTFLGELSFSRNYNIKKLVLPNSFVIKNVPLYDPDYIVFEDVGNLNSGTNLSIAIYCYTGITEYEVKPDNPNYTSIDGIIYTKDMTRVVAIPARYAQQIVIPEGVTAWDTEAMWADLAGNSNLVSLLSNCTGVSIPASLATIDEAQLDMLNRLAEREDFTITVDEGNRVYYVDEEGKLSRHPDLAEKTISILGDSISTFTGVSNDTSVNATLKGGAVYYSAGTLGVNRADTWWQQAVDVLDLRLLVNNSWSGSCVLHTRSGAVGAYVDRCVQLHNDRTGEEPDIIVVFMGTNDFSYYQSVLGTADIDYASLIIAGGDGTYTYAEPATTCEAYAIMLHKMTTRYPDAEVYCMNLLPRRAVDYTGDSITDVGQPTAFNTELAKVIEHFGSTVVDLGNCGISSDVASFDLYMGDRRVHPNAAGMDKMTQAVIDALVGRENASFTVTCDLTNVTANASSGIILSGEAFSATLTAAAGFDELNVKVTMRGTDITESCYDDGKVIISTVTGDVVITATAEVDDIPDNYRWELSGSSFVCTEGENALIKKAGTVVDGVINDAYFQLEKPVVLRHDQPWVVQWQCAGDWSGLLLSAKSAVHTEGNNYLFRTYNATKLLAFGESRNGGYHNYGIALTGFGIDTSSLHTYRVENRIDSDGSNMAYLLVDGVELGAMNHYYISGTNDQGKTVDWLNGRDFCFFYVGASGHTINNCALEYLQIWEAGEPTESLALRYDDHIDVTGKAVEIIDAGTPTSYQVGYGVEENTVLDTAVVTLEGDTLVATGIGTAKVNIDGTLYEVTVTAAPISLLLLVGQSNMEGNEGDANQSIVCPDGMVYATYGDRYDMNIDNATHYAPSALTGQYREINTVGGTDGLCDYPVYMLTDEGAGRKGPDSGFAYEWVRQTGEKVWIVNASHGGTSLNVWQPGTTQYEECQAMFGACTETLRKEIAAGHFTLSHMAYFWCQGCNDRTQTAQWYVDKYLAMHESFKTELAFDHDSDSTTADRTFEFGGIIPVRAGNAAACYRDGVNSDVNSYTYHESFLDLRMSGPRVAQYWMGNNPELADIWNVCTIGEDWVWMPDGTNGVADYFQTHYENGTVDYTTQVTQSKDWYTPTTPAAVHDSIHYNQIGYNEVGRESVRNALIMMGINEDYEEETTVTFVDWTGYKEVGQLSASTAAHSGTLVVPIVSPVTRCKDVTYSLTQGLNWEYYDLIAESAEMTGTLTAIGAQGSVNVVKAEPGAYFEDHLSQLPEELCCGVNLWNVLEHDSQYYTVSGWGTHSSGEVYSITIPVTPGDRIFATSYGKAGQNGHASTNGIRTTFLGEYGVIKTLTPAETYNEFSQNGYLTAPEGTVAINVPMWTNDDSNELYILNLSHDTDDGVCGICGKDTHVHSWNEWRTVSLPTEDALGEEQRSCTCGETESREVEGVWRTHELGKYLVTLPENYCAGTNLWTLLPHTQTYYYSGIHWGTNASADVWSVTIPVEPGDRIFATSFGKAGENGYTSNGIRVTFFDVYGVCKTTAPAETYAEFTSNGGYLVVPEGALAVNVPMYGNSDGHELYILNAEHAYSGIVCPACGTEHPNAANFQGKVISILSASTSTFAGYIPVADGFNLEHRARYPQNNLLTDVNDTWWMQLINQMDAQLGINDSWAGSQVLNTIDGNSGDLGEDAAMASLTRIQNLGANGTPDLILFFGGGNDIGRGVVLGSFDPATAPNSVDLTATKWDNFADAYVATILRLKHFYPNARIVAMTTYPMPSYVTETKLDRYGPVIQAICDHYGIEYVSLRNCGVTFDMLPDGIHPDAQGMDYITNAMLDYLLESNTMEPGAHIVYSVKHELTNVTASLGYYKGISKGKTFEEVLTGENLTVSVTMGGNDITKTAYVDGKVTIADVTGDIVITAKGTYNVDGHLQQLPERMCPGTNLWAVLRPENIYYTANGWGNTSAGTSWSITFPIKAGDRIWATSLGAYPENGSSANGVRVTWFDENGILATLDRSTVYAEFAKYGYITAPEGATALNLPMTNNELNYAVYILSAEHAYESIVTAPTCTEQGYTTHTCACGESFVDSYAEANGHSYAEWQITAASKCETAGEERRDCGNCDHYETRTVDALGHNLTQHEAKAPTCTEIGWDAYETCSRCDYSTYVELPAIGHRYESVVTAPTCTEQGYTTHTCACGESFVDSYVEANGHSYAEWQIITAPKCETVGEERRDCGSCDHYETRTVDALGHNLTQHEAKAPACTAIGWDAYETCSRCDHSTYVELPATGKHTYSGDQDADCNACGFKREVVIKTTPMYRLYNPNSGEHFYTGSIEERDMLVSVGWQYEGVSWNAPISGGAPVYRLFNPNNGDHHYTMSAEERDMLVSVGWQYEGVAWNSAGPQNVPLYRLYNPNADCGSHHYTGSVEERDFLVSLGWIFEGIGWFGMLR